MTEIRTTEDVCREFFSPAHVPFLSEVQLKELAMALDVHHADQLVRAHERGARAMRKKVNAELDAWRADYWAKKEDAQARKNSRGFWINAARVLLLWKVTAYMRGINEEEDL